MSWLSAFVWPSIFAAGAVMPCGVGADAGDIANIDVGVATDGAAGPIDPHRLCGSSLITAAPRVADNRLVTSCAREATHARLIAWSGCGTVRGALDSNGTIVSKNERIGQEIS